MVDSVPENSRRTRVVVTNPLGQSLFDIGFPVMKVTDAMGDEVSPVAVYVDGEGTEDFIWDIASLSVTLDAAAAHGAIVTIEGSTPVKKKDDYPHRGGLRSTLLNADFRRIIEMLQEMRRDIGRSMQLNKAESNSVSGFLPQMIPGRALKWGDSGLENSIVDIDTLEGAVVEAAESASVAGAAAEEAQTILLQVQAIYDNFDDRYLGTKSNDPSVDNDGNVLVDGALYFNTTTNLMRVYDLGNTQWNNVTTALLNGSVTTDKLGALAVIEEKMATGSVNARVLNDGAVQWSKFASGVVGVLSDLVAGTASKLVSAAALKAWWENLEDSADFTSADQTVTASSSITVAHGLGAAPSRIEVWIKHTTAGGNFAAGDMTPAPTVNEIAGSYYGTVAAIDAGNTTHVRVTTGAAIVLLNKTSGAGYLPTLANIRYVVKAWK